ncbi:archaeosortase/exosortase family protein [Dolichospermum sp. UHCC 0260]|uniref:archaeosortase/exosortase family protein n=1 Tax=Dolichospermum sp. UHCC 0260 TaxID=2590025 RepID=UPI001447523D|nr:archaeosortase/exosortase family protein [Dolichospermum sp. UHCC 0260]MTJ34096.1 hypothetical protein [Dolichospermum sp. UHCC 0260]
MLKTILAMTGKIEKFREVNFLNYTFLILFIFGLVTSTHLTLHWRVEQNLNDSFFQLLLYASVIFHIYERRNNLVFASQFPANLIGCCLIIIPYIKADFVVQEISISWYFLPLVSAIGLALLASGFPGIKQFKRELAVIAIFPLTFVFVKLLTMLISIQALSAQITSFLLWYLGFDSTIAGTIIYVNGGAIDVFLPCTGMFLLIMLLKFSFVLAILFPSLLKNIYLPFILSVVFSLVFSIGRLMIMALVVTDKPTFDYWHGSQGGDIFTVLTFLAFGAVILFLSPNHQTSPSLTTAPPEKSQPISWVMVLTGISLVIILLNFFINPQAGLSANAVYRFPSEIPLPGWQFVASQPVTLSPEQLAKEKEIAPPVVNTDITVDKTKEILSGQIYRYQKAGQNLNVNLSYVPLNTGDVKYYYQRFSYLTDLPKLNKPVEKANPKGYHLEFSDQQNRYLTACINSQGKSTVTLSQFNAYFYPLYLNPVQWLNLFNAKQIIRDHRCIWGQLSLTKADTSDVELETTWQALLSYWYSNLSQFKL